ncbi:MAG: HAMP domain-containing histidine kinase, partial [Bdellovibrionales bacterium]|nr:HAMP domain-containing histidine kinase [Bdellovibrionales bacterium]
IVNLMEYISRRLQVMETILDVLLIERKLNEASQLWEKTFEGITDPVAIVDKDFNLLRGNRAFNNFTNHKKCYESFFAGTQPCEACPILKISSKKSKVTERVIIEDKTFEVHSSAIFLYNANQVAGYANHYIDLTDTLRLKSRIIQSEKMAAMGHLAGNIAHELNNPLTGIRSLTQLLIKEIAKDSQVAQDLIEIEKAAARCQKIITNLLEYTKDQQGLLKPVHLYEVVEKTIPMLKAALRPYNLHIEPLDKNIVVKANEQLLQQVLFNIVLNATQAMSGQGEITIELAQVDSHAQLSVSDTGPGIPSEMREKVFDPFFTTKEKGKGTGLGLSMVKKIVESFSGTVWVDPHVSEGTRITLNFPLCDR